MGSSQDIANTVWAFATLKVPAPKLFDAVAHDALERLGACNSQNLANTDWAFATLNRPAPKLFDAVAHDALERLGECNSEQFAQLAFSLLVLHRDAAVPGFLHVCEVVASLVKAIMLAMLEEATRANLAH